MGTEDEAAEEEVEDKQEDDISTDEAGWSTEDTESTNGTRSRAEQSTYASEGTESSAQPESEKP